MEYPHVTITITRLVRAHVAIRQHVRVPWFFVHPTAWIRYFSCSMYYLPPGLPVSALIVRYFLHLLMQAHDLKQDLLASYSL